MKNHLSLGHISIFVALYWFAVLISSADEDGATAIVPLAEVSSVGFVTRDLDATVAFYTNVLGFSVVGTADVTAEKTLQVIGARSRGTIGYAALAPQAWIDGNKSLALVSFFEIPGAPGSGLSQDANRESVPGEAILAHRVDDVDVVARRARESGASVLAPLGDSGTSRTSRSIALFDPNGIRIEIYQY